MSDSLLASATDLGVRLGQDPGDGKLLLALRLASGRFQDQTNNPILKVTGDVITLDAAGSRVLLLPAAPVLGVSSVTVQGEPVDFEWSAAGAIRVSSPMADVWNSVAVTYDHGYDPVPAGVQDVVLEQAATIYSVLPGVSAYTTGTESRTYLSSLAVGTSSAWSAAVQKYRLRGA